MNQQSNFVQAQLVIDEFIHNGGFLPPDTVFNDSCLNYYKGKDTSTMSREQRERHSQIIKIFKNIPLERIEKERIEALERSRREKALPNTFSRRALAERSARDNPRPFRPLLGDRVEDVPLMLIQLTAARLRQQSNQEICDKEGCGNYPNCHHTNEYFEQNYLGGKRIQPLDSVAASAAGSAAPSASQLGNLSIYPPLQRPSPPPPRGGGGGFSFSLRRKLKKSVKKSRKSVRKSVRNSKKSVRKSKKSPRKSVRKSKKSARK